jgi:integrase
MESSSFQAWLDMLTMNSEHTAKTYKKAILLFCKEQQTTPEALLNMKEELRNRLITYAKKKGPTLGSLTASAVKSWLEFNGIYLPYRFRIKNIVRYRETVPTPEQIETLLLHADLKTRAIAALIAFSGLRPEAIGNANGTDGLRLKDLPELKIEGKNLGFTDETARIIVRETLSKARHRYFTFLPKRGTNYILAYLKTRKKLNENDPLIAAKDGDFLKTESISKAIRRAMDRAGLEDFRPYDLRHYFATRMLLAEAGGVLPREYRVFWMGHKGDIEARYTLNKYTLPKELVLDMKLKFERAHELFFRSEDNAAKQA